MECLILNSSRSDSNSLFLNVFFCVVPSEYDPVCVCAGVSQLAHNVLRTICFLELVESVIVLWLFWIQPPHNFLGVVHDSCLALGQSQYILRNLTK